MRRRLALLLLVAVLLSGCWDRMEIEDQTYLVAIGVDRVEEGEFMVTALVAITPELTAGGVQPPAYPERARLAARILTARGRTVTGALHTLNGGLTRRLDMRQVRALVVGEELAREGLEPMVTELTRSPWARGNMFFAQARGKAYEIFMKMEPVSEVNPPKMVEGLLMQAKSLHMTPPVRMHNFVARYAASGGDPYLSLIAVNPGVTNPPQEPAASPRASALAGELSRSGGNPVEFVGTAIFRGDKLAGYLTVDETQMLLALRGEMGKAYITFPNPDQPEQPVTMRFHMENMPTFKPSLRGGNPHVKMRLLFEGEVLAVPGGTDYTGPAARTRLEKAAVKYIRKTAYETLEKLRDWEADPVGFGHLYRGWFSSWVDWEAFDWHRRISQLEVELEAEMRIRRFGLVIGPDKIKESR